MANLVVRILRAISLSALQQLFTLLFEGALALELTVALDVDFELSMIDSTHRRRACKIRYEFISYKPRVKA